MSDQQLSPIGALATGAVAGAVGVLAMDLVWARARLDGSDRSFVDYEFSTGSTSDYDEAATPAKVGRRVVEDVFDEDLPPESAGPMNDIVHWATGLGYGLATGTAFRLLSALATGNGAPAEEAADV